jgi:4-hydroxy-tetrahydrodipicolinate reductase
MSRIAIAGAAGRMGRQLVRAVRERDGVELAAAIEHPESAFLGMDAGLVAGDEAAGVNIVADASAQANHFDTIIDFSSPDSTAALLQMAVDQDKQVVIGTTGLNDRQLQQLDDAAGSIALVYASNYSAGVTLSLELLRRAAAALGDQYDVEVIEAHHHHKVDAPSGTALSMGQAVADALGRDLQSCAVYGREGITGARDRQTIGFATVRAGDIIGEHTVMFCGEGERLEITHRATDRMTFARGAVRAAHWLSQGRAAGRYDMSDVLAAP